ncbi:hypothetical protein PHLGIDRAFT_509247 [Phlebiopsis gigantea 11061_1 CR5-6]|uniref:Uncharacterized protein n=1 Tax=Phlebiopsis gigantea (strain 11061_1 CR5-6) TaxID=745531 RepID=A0A0C3N9I7_PHLG1|nr:hypothetical protein PHLGIDRAFT_509247 [Phlebiopsis gigantea 11061_1 CR5-6]
MPAPSRKNVPKTSELVPDSSPENTPEPEQAAVQTAQVHHDSLQSQTQQPGNPASGQPQGAASGASSGTRVTVQTVKRKRQSKNNEAPDDGSTVHQHQIPAAPTKSKAKVIKLLQGTEDKVQKHQEAAEMGQQLIQATQDMEGCSLGFAKMDIFSLPSAPQLTKGTLNRRALTLSHARSLYKVFKEGHKQAFNSKNVLLIGIQKSWVDESSLQSSCQNLKEVVWTSAANKQKAILLNGQHRITANELLVTELVTSLQKLQNLDQALMSLPQQQDCNKKKDTLKVLIKKESMWGIQFFNLDLIQSLPNHSMVEHILASNNPTLQKQDTAQQGLALALALIRKEAPEMRESTAKSFTMTNPGAAYIIKHPLVRELMVDLYDYDAFNNSFYFKANQMKQWKADIGMIMVTLLKGPLFLMDTLFTPVTFPSHPTVPSQEPNPALSTLLKEAPKPLRALCSQQLSKDLEGLFTKHFHSSYNLLGLEPPLEEYSSLWSNYVLDVREHIATFAADGLMHLQSLSSDLDSSQVETVFRV